MQSQGTHLKAKTFELAPQLSSSSPLAGSTDSTEKLSVCKPILDKVKS